MARDTVLEGVFAINKPMGMSSAQVIRDCQTYFNPSTLFRPLIQQELDMRARESNSSRRRRSRAKRDTRVKLGHGGTLDPLATGVLILGVGRGTKELPQFLNCTKTYETVVLFGASTDTYDRVGRILQRRAYDDVTRDAVEAALAGFRGRYRQMPPLYSALKMNGKPLYEYAREGLAIPREIETREVEVSHLELLEWYEPGTHNHRWPDEEAGMAEQSLAERVWRREKDQAAGKTRPLSAEEEKSDREALAAHENFKRKAEEKQDMLVYDKPAKRRRGDGGGGGAYTADTFRISNSNISSTSRRKGGGDVGGNEALLMSGALGQLPSSYRDNVTSGKLAETAGAGAGGEAGAGPLKPARPSGRGSNLVPPPVAPNTPPPWQGKGPPAVKIRLTVSSGFYVRSFCHDLGEKLGSAAMMAELARTRQSGFCVGSDNVLEYDDVCRGEAVWGPQVERLLTLWNKGEIGKAEGGGGEATAAEAAVATAAETTVAEASPAQKEASSSEARKMQQTPDTEPEWDGITDEPVVAAEKAESAAVAV